MPWRLATAAVVLPGWLHCSTTLALNSALYLRLTGVGLPVLFGDCSIVCSIADSRFDGRNPPPIPRTHQYDFAGRLLSNSLEYRFFVMDGAPLWVVHNFRGERQVV